VPASVKSRRNFRTRRMLVFCGVIFSDKSLTCRAQLTPSQSPDRSQVTLQLTEWLAIRDRRSNGNVGHMTFIIEAIKDDHHTADIRSSAIDAVILARKLAADGLQFRSEIRPGVDILPISQPFAYKQKFEFAENSRRQMRDAAAYPAAGARECNSVKQVSGILSDGGRCS
jgi:hypothetical protein